MNFFKGTRVEEVAASRNRTPGTLCSAALGDYLGMTGNRRHEAISV